VDRIREWLDEGAGARVDSLGQGHQVLGGDRHALREASRKVHADEPPLRAQVPLVPRAACACTTRKERVHRNATADPLVTGAASRSYDRPRELMAHDEGWYAVRHAANVALHFGTTDSHRLRGHEHLAVAGPRLGHRLDRHLPGTVPDQRSHRRAGYGS